VSSQHRIHSEGNPQYFLRPGCEVSWWACLSVCMSVCLSVCMYVCLHGCRSSREPISRTHVQTSPNFYTHIAHGRDLNCDTLSTSGFVDDVICALTPFNISGTCHPHITNLLCREKFPPNTSSAVAGEGGATCLCVCICLPVCLSASIISEESHVQLSPIFMQVASNRGSVLLWQRSDTLCTSGFVYAVSHVCVMARNRRRERSTPSYCVVFRIFV